MELISLEGLTLGSVLAGLITAPILLALGKLVSWFSRNRVLGRVAFSTAARYPFRISTFLFAAIFSALLVWSVGFNVFGQPLNPVVVGSVAFASCVCISEWRFAKVGIHAAQLSVATGTDYVAALNLCRDGFLFLGTGASKLTGAANFQDTAIRCAHGRLCFLLSKPNNLVIGDAERKADVAPGAYTRSIKKSLKILKRLRDDSKYGSTREKPRVISRIFA